VTSPLRPLVESRLSALIGLRLLGIGRAADLATFTFGTSEADPRPWYLHVQCAWRLEGPEGIITGRADLWLPENSEDPSWLQDGWSYDRNRNLRDARLERFHQETDSRPETRHLTALRGDDHGGFELDLSGGFRVTAFPQSSRGEHWRLFRREDEDHFVVPPEGA
jgi:hypothetical protein